MAKFDCISPIDGSVVYEGVYHTQTEIEHSLKLAHQGQKQWRNTPLDERIKKLKIAVNHLYENRKDIGREITEQIGRPLRYSENELGGVKERSDMMFRLAPDALQNHTPIQTEGFQTYIAHEPLGIIAVIAPWNYPFLTSVNAIIPALIAGNAVILKTSSQTPLVALRYVQAFKKAAIPDGVFQSVFLTHAMTNKLISDALIDYVAFTGSVAGGHAITQALSHKFTSAGLELGGKDPAYVRIDADPSQAAVALADGAFFNSGQSCCGIERIYVHETHFDIFLETIIAEAKALKLGNPREAETTLGPMVSAKGADSVRAQIKTAIEAGAKAHLPIDENLNSPYLSPQILTHVTHDMPVMQEESFGPIVCLMSVKSDEEAITLMNDSQFGLTGSIWTQDVLAAKRIGDQLETGTVFMNRCDYLDPALAWTGVKKSGRGVTLSALGFNHLTRPKSYHFKLPVSH